MGLIGLAILGMVVGAAATEIIRATKPELVEKVEDAAKRFVDSFCGSKSDDVKKTE